MEQVLEFLKGLFSTDLWPRRWVCGEWSEFHGWLYILSDTSIGIAYTGIPIIILSYIRKKNERIPFQHIFILFGAFILFCGLTHFMDAIIFWWPAYRLSAVIRFLTGAVSVATLVALYKILPEVFSLKTSAEFEHELDQKQKAENDLKTKNEEVIQSNKDLESFAYSVSHDLRAPLRAINAYSEFLQEDNLGQLNEQGKNYLMNIRENASKMEALISGLLHFSRVSQKDIVKVNVDMNWLVKEVVDTVKKGFPDIYDIRIDPLPAVCADATLMKQLMENILSNAFKYSQKTEKPIIHIGASDENSNVKISVRDNGTGFDNNYSYKIFQVFQRLHSEEEFEGTGVGMAIAKRIVEKHGGSIHAEGKPGEGAVFYFTIPG